MTFVSLIHKRFYFFCYPFWLVAAFDTFFVNRRMFVYVYMYLLVLCIAMLHPIRYVL